MHWRPGLRPRTRAAEAYSAPPDSIARLKGRGTEGKSREDTAIPVLSGIAAWYRAMLAFAFPAITWEGKGKHGSFRLRMNVWVCTVQVKL